MTMLITERLQQARQEISQAQRTTLLFGDGDCPGLLNNPAVPTLELSFNPTSHAEDIYCGIKRLISLPVAFMDCCPDGLFMSPRLYDRLAKEQIYGRTMLDLIRAVVLMEFGQPNFQAHPVIECENLQGGRDIIFAWNSSPAHVLTSPLPSNFVQREEMTIEDRYRLLKSEPEVNGVLFIHHMSAVRGILAQ